MIMHGISEQAMLKDPVLLDTFSRIVMGMGLDWFFHTQYDKRDDQRITLKHVMDAYAKYLRRDHAIKVVFVNSGNEVQYYIQDCSLEALTMLKLTIGANGT